MSFMNCFTPGLVTSITTGASAATAISLAKGGQVLLVNQDATNGIFFKFGISSDTVTNTTGTYLAPNARQIFTVPASATHIITLAAANTPILNVTQGWGSS